MLVQPLSDVPAAALWGMALWVAARGGMASAAGAGAAVALAIVTRPNIAPLAVVVGLIVAVRPGTAPRPARVRHAVRTGSRGIALLNAHWYGSPLRSGYGSVDVLYRWNASGPTWASHPVVARHADAAHPAGVRGAIASSRGPAPRRAS